RPRGAGVARADRRQRERDRNGWRLIPHRRRAAAGAIARNASHPARDRRAALRVTQHRELADQLDLPQARGVITHRGNHLLGRLGSAGAVAVPLARTRPSSSPMPNGTIVAISAKTNAGARYAPLPWSCVMITTKPIGVNRIAVTIEIVTAVSIRRN